MNNQQQKNKGIFFGAGWLKESKAGNSYIQGRSSKDAKIWIQTADDKEPIEISSFRIIPNNKKSTDKQPDYYVIYDTETAQ